MTYEERMMQIKAILSQILMTYELSRGMKDNEPAQMAEIDTIAKAINEKFPTDTNRDHIAGTMERVEIWLKGHYNKRSWPTGKDFMNALGKSMESVNASIHGMNSGVWTDGQIDPLKLAARRIENGEPVSDSYLWGSLAVKLIRGNHITEQQRRAYIKGFVEKARKLYGDGYARYMYSEYEARHEAALG